ncbi:MAG: SGNH/GDSL hydrolase family protein [Thiotrichales bacterium]|jgi:lysophospholipase L1-like esterase|nr:SGNH/GDSL hydrolase family protein [Thiotrichales bacterium]
MTIFAISAILAVAMTFVAAFFYVSRIISLPPQGRAVEYINSNSENNQRVIACIGDSLTHGNIGASWVDQLRKEFPSDVFLNEGINGDVVWQVHQRLDPIIKCNPDVVILMIGSNDAMASFNLQSGKRYKRKNNLPDIPSFQSYQKLLSELLNQLTEVNNVFLCTLPPIGENKDSKINQHINQFNDFIRQITQEKGLSLLPVSEYLWSDLALREFPYKNDYNPNSIPLIRRMYGGIMHHYIFKQSWDKIARSKKQWLLFDQIHLSERASNIVFKLVKNAISKN